MISRGRTMLLLIARFRDRSLIATFCPLRQKLVDTVDWQVAKKIGSLSFYTEMR